MKYFKNIMLCNYKNETKTYFYLCYFDLRVVGITTRSSLFVFLHLRKVLELNYTIKKATNS
ncbi:Uncharacterised protein [Myroides odoratus]|uniref:Uncharacterized protein n=1 Tax=Myroides odoratus TaxID=256 RepID=A0A378RKD2_MYROD|nr:Uncharacterised protein [Myroides odoratus]